MMEDCDREVTVQELEEQDLVNYDRMWKEITHRKYKYLYDQGGQNDFYDEAEAHLDKVLKLKNHGIDEEIQAKAYQQAKDIYDYLSDDKKWLSTREDKWKNEWSKEEQDGTV